MLNKIKLSNFKYLISSYIINFVFCLIPVSFIAGNLAINLNVLAIIFLGLIFHGNKILNFQILFFDKLLITIFLFLTFSGILNSLNISNFSFSFIDQNIFYKSIAFLRYIILYFVIRLLIQEEILNFKVFFFVCSLCVLFVSLDLIYQLIVGIDIFGNVKTPNKLSGPFGEEKIAGSYLQRFGIFIFFLFPLITKSKNKIYPFLLSLFLFALIFFSIVISGNRMPLILFLFMFTILFLIERRLRKLTLVFGVLALAIFFLVYNLNEAAENYTKHFINSSFQIFYFLKEVFLNGNSPVITNNYIKEFYTGYAAWKENPVIGGGVDSFYSNCSKTIAWCASHPHNYYLEIMTELGLIGLLLIVILFCNLVFISLSNKDFVTMYFEKNLITPFILIMFVEIFPIKTTGSFFTTGNSTFIFIIIGIIIGLYEKSNYNKV